MISPMLDTVSPIRRLFSNFFPSVFWHIKVINGLQTWSLFYVKPWVLFSFLLYWIFKGFSNLLFLAQSSPKLQSPTSQTWRDPRVNNWSCLLKNSSAELWWKSQQTGDGVQPLKAEWKIIVKQNKENLWTVTESHIHVCGGGRSSAARWSITHFTRW